MVPTRNKKYRYISITLALLAIFQSKVLFGSEVSIPDTSIVTETQFSIPILTSDLTGLNVISFDCDISYNESLIEFVGFSQTNTLSIGLTITVNSETKGVLIIRAAGTQVLSGGGELITLSFTTKSDTGKTEIAFDLFVYNENIFPTLKNGSVNVADIVVSVDSDDIQIKTPALGFALYPNPFNGSITIAYNLRATTELAVNIFNLNGEIIKTIYSGMQSEGNHLLRWNGKSDNNTQVASGVYFCRLTTNNFTRSIRITYIK